MGARTFRQVVDSSNLPSPPAIALRILELAERPDVDLSEFAEVVAADSAIAGKILETANSSFYAQVARVSTIDRALMVLGFRTVRTLVLGFSLVKEIRGVEVARFDYEGHWRRSVIAGAAAKALAARANIDECEQAFVGGLLHGIGMLAMATTLGEEYAALVADSEGHYGDLRLREKERYGFDHASVSAEFARLWALPRDLAGPIGSFAVPMSAPVQTRRLSASVGLGALAAEAFCTGDATESTTSFTKKCEDWLGLSSQTAVGALEEARSESNRLMGLFDLPPAIIPDPWKILERANRALAATSLEEHQRGHDVAESTGQVAGDGTTSRQQFDEEIEKHCRISAEKHTPLGLILIDLERLQRVNEERGLQLGDAILSEASDALKRTVSGRDVVARRGAGFAVLVPGRDEKMVIRFAEEIRGAVETAASNVEGGMFQLEATVGVACAETTIPTNAAQLVTAAGWSLHESKIAERRSAHLWGDLAA